MKRWPLHKAYFWETAPFFRLLLPFAAGIVWYDLHWQDPISLSNAWFAAALTLVIALIATYFFRFNSRLQLLFLPLLALALFFSGYCVSLNCDARSDPAWFARHGFSSDQEYLVRMSEEPTEKESTWKLPVTLVGQITNGRTIAATGKAVVYVYKRTTAMELHKGDTAFLPAGWQPIANAGNPFEFDYAAWCRRNNLYYQQFCTGDAVKLYARCNAGKASLTEKVHDWCMLTLATYLPNPDTRGLMQAMLLGDETHLNHDLLQSYSETGIVHIIAISGGNVLLFVTAIGFVLFFMRHNKYTVIRYLLALPLVWFYVVMAGAPPSAIRAAVMFTLLTGGMLLQKEANSLNHLFATAFLLLCAQPAWLFSVGFQLSFVAVLSLIVFYRHIYNWIRLKHKQLKKVWRAIAASLAAEILVAPLVIYYFHTFPLLFLVANVLALIFMAFVINLGLAILATAWWTAAAKLIGWLTNGLVTGFDYIVSGLQRFNPVSFRFLMLSGFELVLVYAAIAGISVFLMRRQRAALLYGLTAASLLGITICYDQWIIVHQQRLVIYNTGTANHIELISGRYYKLLYHDTADRNKAAYTTLPAHTHWGAWHADSATGRELIRVGRKTILILNYPINPTNHFPVDYLVINYTGPIDPETLKQVFSPAMVVIGNNYSRRQQKTWRDKFRTAGVAVHCVGLDGAFVVD